MSLEASGFGVLYMAFAVSVWIYYTVWMLVTPIVDQSHPVQEWFPDRETGLLITSYGAYLLMGLLSTMAGLILVNDKATEA